MLTRSIELLRDEEGAALVEYALLLALIAVVCVPALIVLGNKVANVLTMINAALP